MKILFVLVAIFSMNAFAVCEIPSGGIGSDPRRARALRQTDPSNAFLGDDVLYEGAPCPSGKICLEAITRIRKNRKDMLHGQVIVFNKENGRVDQLLPLRFKKLGAAGGNLRQRGLNPFNPERIARICAELKDEFPLPPNEHPCDDASPYSPVIDMYHVSSDGTSSPFSSLYNSFPQQAKQRFIQILNSGEMTASGGWTQSGSTVQRGGAGTFGRFASFVQDARATLGCENRAPRRDEVLKESFDRGIGRFGNCPFTVTREGGGIRLTFQTTPTFDGANPALNVPAQGRVPLTVDVPTDRCYSNVQDARNGVITCENGFLGLPPVTPTVTPGTRRGDLEDPQVIVKATIRDGEIQNLEVQRNFNFYTDDKLTCEASAAPAGAPAGTGNSRARQR